LNAEYPDAHVTKMLAPTGTTDCGLFRTAATRCYGLWPAVLTFDQFLRVHGNDEFLTVDQLVSGTRVVMRAVEQAAMR
jgi:acetylornithine deacetylase/succinyl-diaminopimelate desuccinylase-like protein